MAVIGLRTLISKQVERVRAADLRRIDGLPREIEARARDVVADRLKEQFYSDLDYRSLLHDLADGIDVSQVQEMADAFPPEYRDLGLALTRQMTEVIDGLSQLVPRSVYETMTGPQSLVPNDVAVWKFKSILEVLDNPMLVFPLMATGALLKKQAAAVRTLYPTLSQAIDAALARATVYAKARKKSFELSPRAEVGVSAWVATSPNASPQAADQRGARLRASQDVVARAKQQAEQRKAQAPKPGQAAQLQTQAQRDPSIPSP